MMSGVQRLPLSAALSKGTEILNKAKELKALEGKLLQHGYDLSIISTWNQQAPEVNRPTPPVPYQSQNDQLACHHPKLHDEPLVPAPSFNLTSTLGDSPTSTNLVKRRYSDAFATHSPLQTNWQRDQLQIRCTEKSMVAAFKQSKRMAAARLLSGDLGGLMDQAALATDAIDRRFSPCSAPTTFGHQMPFHGLRRSHDTLRTPLSGNGASPHESFTASTHSFTHMIDSMRPLKYWKAADSPREMIPIDDTSYLLKWRSNGPSKSPGETLYNQAQTTAAASSKFSGVMRGHVDKRGSRVPKQRLSIPKHKPYSEVTPRFMSDNSNSSVNELQIPRFVMQKRRGTVSMPHKRQGLFPERRDTRPISPATPPVTLVTSQGAASTQYGAIHMHKQGLAQPIAEPCHENKYP